MRNQPDLDWFFDTEFLDTPHETELISIGIVCGAGMNVAPYYAINRDAPWDEILQNEWLVNNVWNQLPHKRVVGGKTVYETIDCDHPDVKTKAEIRRDIEKLMTTYTLQAGRQALWAYFAAYDHLMLSRLWGRMLDLPDYMPMWSHDLMQVWERHDYWPPLRPPKPAGLHNALEDAKWNRDFYYAMMACNGECGSHVGRMP